MPSFHELHGRFAYERFELLTVLSDENILRLWALDHRFAQSGRFHEPSLDVTLRQSPLAQGRGLEPLRRRAHQARSLSPLAQGRGLEHPVDPQRRAATGSPLAQGVDWNSTISLSAASPGLSPLAQGRGLEPGTHLEQCQEHVAPRAKASIGTPIAPMASFSRRSSPSR